MKDFIWVVAGGIMQIPLIEECKRRGYGVICTDGDANAPGATIADQFINIDTYDVYTHIDLANAMSIKPVAVITAGADVGPTVSAIADEIGLPAVPYEVAKRVRNKAQMRRALNASHPVWMEVKFSDDVREKWNSLCKHNNVDPYPCVVKPLERAGSKGITLVKSPFSFERALKKARIADNGMNATCIIEEMLHGYEVATDTFIVDGKYRYANSVYRMFSKQRFGVERGHLNPYRLTPRMKSMIKTASKRLGVDWGAFKVDFIVDDRYGAVISECATRLSGGFDHMYATPVATGMNITGYMVGLALGERPNQKMLYNTLHKVACTYSLVGEPGKIKSIQFPEYEWLRHTFVTKPFMQDVEDCTQRTIFIITVGDDYYQAYKRARIVERETKIEYE